MLSKYIETDEKTGVSYFNPIKPLWNGRPHESKIAHILLPKRKLNNFGDLLGPIISNCVISEKLGAHFFRKFKNNFYTVGSILHFAHDNDYIWGTGINGRIARSSYNIKELNVFSVRGPLTRKFLLEKNISCPEVYGDPALLFGNYFPEYKSMKKENELIVISNYSEKCPKNLPPNTVVRSPLGNPFKIIEDIARSNFVISSSLHAVIIGESLGIPSRFLSVMGESPTKYIDYLNGTNRDSYKASSSVRKCLDLGGQESPKYDKDKIINSFPIDLYYN